jgi:hypothetical protein
VGGCAPVQVSPLLCNISLGLYQLLQLVQQRPRVDFSSLGLYSMTHLSRSANRFPPGTMKPPPAKKELKERVAGGKDKSSWCQSAQLSNCFYNASCDLLYSQCVGRGNGMA